MTLLVTGPRIWRNYRYWSDEPRIRSYLGNHARCLFCGVLVQRCLAITRRHVKGECVVYSWHALVLGS